MMKTLGKLTGFLALALIVAGITFAKQTSFSQQVSRVTGQTTFEFIAVSADTSFWWGAHDPGYVNLTYWASVPRTIAGEDSLDFRIVFEVAYVDTLKPTRIDSTSTISDSAGEVSGSFAMNHAPFVRCIIEGLTGNAELDSNLAGIIYFKLSDD